MDVTSANRLLSARKNLITSVVNPQEGQTMRTTGSASRSGSTLMVIDLSHSLVFLRLRLASAAMAR